MFSGPPSRMDAGSLQEVVGIMTSDAASKGTKYTKFWRAVASRPYKPPSSCRALPLLSFRSASRYGAHGRACVCVTWRSVRAGRVH